MLALGNVDSQRKEEKGGDLVVYFNVEVFLILFLLFSLH